MTDRECMLMGEGTKVKGESDNFDFRGQQSGVTKGHSKVARDPAGSAHAGTKTSSSMSISIHTGAGEDWNYCRYQIIAEIIWSYSPGTRTP